MHQEEKGRCIRKSKSCTSARMGWRIRTIRVLHQEELGWNRRKSKGSNRRIGVRWCIRKSKDGASERGRMLPEESKGGASGKVRVVHEEE